MRRVRNVQNQKGEHMIEIHDSNLHNTWVMRITADRRIEVNEDVEVTEAAKKVLDAMQHLLTPQRTERNFCQRCGKRTKDLAHIHTCTPPQEKNT
jgi:hypothetical protein